MYWYLTLLLYILTLNPCTAVRQAQTQNVTTITAHPIRRPRQSGSGSGRLSLINYRFNRRPKRKNLDIGELKMMLGQSFNSQFMSIEKPPELSYSDAGAIYVVRKDSWRYGEMLQELQTSNLTEQLQEMAGDGFRVEPQYVKVVEKWLLKRASCPVKYAWEDIGALFWPRYIRRGECTSEPGTCSWPSGMHCVPSGTTNIQLLRWQCRTPKGKGRKRGYKGPNTKNYKDEEKPLNVKCNWVRVPYPITSECICTC